MGALLYRMIECETDADREALYRETLASNLHAASDMRIALNHHGDASLRVLWFFLWELEPVEG